MISVERVSLVSGPPRDFFAGPPIPTPGELEGIELREDVEVGGLNGSTDVRIEAANYAGQFLGRPLFRLKCDDGVERRVWVNAVGVESDRVKDYFGFETGDAIPVVLPRRGSRVVWRIADDSPDLMDLARME